LIYRGYVIIAAEYDGKSFVAAFAREGGKEAWRTPRPFNISFSSPVVGHVAGRDQLLISGADQVSSYDPQTGKPLWTAAGTTAATCGTLVWDGDIVFASGGYPKAETVAVRADGSGEVLWKNNKQCYEESLLALEGYVYALTGSGILYCWRGSDGEEMWNQRLKGPVSASPVFAGGHIYWANELGTLYVFKANPAKFELVAENQIGSDAFASPAVCGGQIFLRVGTGGPEQRQEVLYCFGKRK
jgi:outer membrane protein assembly factor BamB